MSVYIWGLPPKTRGRVDYFFFVSIGQNSGSTFNEFHPLCLWAEHYAVFLAKVGLFLEPAAVG